MKAVVKKGQLRQEYDGGTSVSYQVHPGCDLLELEPLAGHAHKDAAAADITFWPLRSNDDLFLVAATPEAVRDGVAPLWTMRLRDDGICILQRLEVPKYIRHMMSTTYATVYAPTESGDTYVAFQKEGGGSIALFRASISANTFAMELLGCCQVLPDYFEQESGGDYRPISLRPWQVPVVVV